MAKSYANLSAHPTRTPRADGADWGDLDDTSQTHAKVGWAWDTRVGGRGMRDRVIR